MMWAMKLSSRVGALLVVVCIGCSSPDATSAAAASPYLELSPMVGHTTSTNSRLWAKASAPARLSVRIGTSSDLNGARSVRGPGLEPDTGLMGHVLVEGLEPKTRYYYCLQLDETP